MEIFILFVFAFHLPWRRNLKGGVTLRYRLTCFVKLVLFLCLKCIVIMSKKHAMYTKILIDLEEYIKLLHIQERVNKQEDLINARLQKDISTASTSKTDSEPQTENTQNVENSQSGYGASAVNDELIKHITNLVTQQIQSQFQLLPTTTNTQEGAGSNDLIKQFPEQIIEPESTAELKPPSIVIHKSQQNDNFDNERLINLVPAMFRERAKKLIKELMPFSSDLTWNSSGTIFLDQNSLPSSNIFQIFPYLFKRVQNPQNHADLLELATKIASLGLGHLINKRLTLGLNRKKTIDDQDKLHLQIKTSKHWWYLGP